MDKNSARELMNVAFSMDKDLGRMFEILGAMEDSDMKQKISKSVEEIMFHITVDIILEIEKIYPELNPDT